MCLYLKDRFSKEEFEKLYNSMSVTDLADELGVTRQTIITFAKKCGLSKKTNGRILGTGGKTIKITKEELERLYNTTKTSSLANKLRISVPTLLRLLEKNGIEKKKLGSGWRFRKRKIIVEG